MSNVKFHDSSREAAPVGSADVALPIAQEHPARASYHDVTKRAFDVLVATSAIFLLLPLISLSVVLLLLVQGRPIFIRHRRVGRDGRIFECFKLRTMVTNSEQVLAEHLAQDLDARREWNASRKLRADPRVTPVGKALRKSSVDELPQLLNILVGEMSFVGPRPIVQDEVAYYGPLIKDYYKVRPGLTGLWQVSGRSDTSYDQRVSLDVQYVKDRSFPLDLGIMLRTVPAVLRSKGSY